MCFRFFFKIGISLYIPIENGFDVVSSHIVLFIQHIDSGKMFKAKNLYTKTRTKILNKSVMLMPLINGAVIPTIGLCFDTFVFSSRLLSQ